MTRRRYPTALLAILLWSVLSSSLFFVSTVLAADATATSSSYYDVLEVDPKADAKSIKKQYRKLALRWHPDKHQSDADKEEATRQFTLINEAFETLGDDERRKEYDASLRQERRQQRGSASARGSGSGSGQQARYDYDDYQQQQYQYGQQQQYQRQQYGGPEESYYYYDQYQEPMYEQQANAYTAYSYRGPHRDPYEQFNSFFSGKYGYDDDDDAYYDEYDMFFGSGRRSQQRYQRHQRPRPQSLDDWLDLTADKAQQAMRAAEQAVDRGIDWIGHAIADLARDIFEPNDDDDHRDGYGSWNSRRRSGSTSQKNNSKWHKQKRKAKQWWDKVQMKSRQWSQKIRRSKHTRKLKRTAKKVKSKFVRWVRKIDQSIDRQKLELWARKVQQKASHISQNIGRAINGILFGENEDDGSGENYAYSSKSSRTYYQNGVETTVQTFHDGRGNRIEEVYLNGMLAERHVNGVPDVIY